MLLIHSIYFSFITILNKSLFVTYTFVHVSQYIMVSYLWFCEDLVFVKFVSQRNYEAVTLFCAILYGYSYFLLHFRQKKLNTLFNYILQKEMYQSFIRWKIIFLLKLIMFVVILRQIWSCVRVVFELWFFIGCPFGHRF